MCIRDSFVPILTVAEKEGDPTGTLIVSQGRPCAKGASLSLTHLLTHFPKDPNCPTCSKCKIQRAQCRKKTGPADGVQAENFGDIVTADHIICGPNDTSRHGDTVSCVIHDRATKRIGNYPAKSKSAEATKEAFQKFLGDVVPKKVYTDNSKEFEAALRDLHYPHETSTPHRPETNGIAERAVRKVLDGSRSTLLQSGLPHCFWAEATRAYTFVRDAVEITVGGKTPYERLFGKFTGPLIPFGAAVEYRPSAERESSQIDLSLIHISEPTRPY